MRGGAGDQAGCCAVMMDVARMGFFAAAPVHGIVQA